MRDRKLDRLFHRFRTKGDTRALGEVFDASAPELLRVAMSLVADPGEADDLLQATYLTAIERAPAWDARRRLVPWLLGILVNHAHDLRKKRGRALEPGRLGARESSDPLDEATLSELSETLRSTLAGLPARYREVLQPFVERGERPADIAARLGRPPGTVRMQIHRGLDLLRKGLPASFALSVLVSTAGRGLASVRAEVLAHGSAQASALAGATAGATAAGATYWTLGGITVSKKIVLVAATLVVVGSLAWVARQAADQPTSSRAPALSGAHLARPELSASEWPERAIEAPDAPDAADVAGSATGGERREHTVVVHDAALAGVTGRVVEQDGTPVTGVSVMLYELGLEMLSLSPRAALDGDAGRRLVRARARTDATGRYLLTGARAATLHGIGVDPGGERPFLRVVDEALVPGELTELSDLVLPAVLPVSGRVVDASGRPVAGARVRAGRLPDYVEWDIWAPIGANMPIWIQRSPLQLVVSAPPELAEIEALLPFPVTFSGPDGRFTLAGARAENVSVVVDHAGFVPLVRKVGAAQEGRRDVGDLELTAGLSVSGRVVDDEGRAVVGAEVCGGAAAYLGWGNGPQFAPLSARATSDASGDFSVRGIPEGHDTVVLAVRRSPAHPWSAQRVEDTGLQTLKLPSETTVSVRVEAPDGAPVTGAQLAVGRPGLLGAMLSGGALLDPREVLGRVEELGAGRYAVHGLQSGIYVLRVAAGDHALAEKRLRVKRNTDELVVRLAAARDRRLQVVDALSGAPLERARVELLTGTGATQIAQALTDGEGRAVLERTPLELDDDVHLRVDHPAYGARKVAVDFSVEEPLVQLAPAGTVVLRVRWSGGQPVAPMMVELDEPAGDAYPDYLAKRFGVTDAQGDIRLRAVAPGPWRWRLFERYLDGDVIGLLAGEAWPRIVSRGMVDVRPGEQTVIDVVLEPENDSTLPKGSARLTGRVTLDGVAPPDLMVSVRMLEDGVTGEAETEVLPDGSYLLEELPAGQARVTVHESTREGPVRWTFSVDQTTTLLEAGRTGELDFAWHEVLVGVRVEDPDGAPVAGVGVTAHAPGVSNWTWFETDAEGVTEVRLRRPGPVRLAVDSHEHGVASAEVELVAGTNESLTLVLDHGAPFGGRLTVPPGTDVGERARAGFHVMRKDGDSSAYLTVTMPSRSAEFHVLGLQPGSYTANLSLPGQEFGELEFELPEGGRADFVLEFTPK